MTIKSSILETIGQTPIIRINNIAPEGVEMFVKLEAANPGGSVKDRLALSIIEAEVADLPAAMAEVRARTAELADASATIETLAQLG